jgi:arginyl-tRNA synthetase
MKKSDGSWTYFGVDTAYHLQKLERSDELINIWGADHSGTVKRTQAAVAALAGREVLDVKLVQMVQLLRAGEPVKMSKRSAISSPSPTSCAKSARTWSASSC